MGSLTQRGNTCTWRWQNMSMVVNASGLMQRAYSGNVKFRDDGYRKSQNNHDVMAADRKAMLRALDQLDALDFDSEDSADTKAIYQTVTAYTEVYNNAVESALGSKSTDIQRSGKKMKALTKEYKDQLAEIGIKIKSDGTLKIDKTELKKATTREVERIFGDEGYKSTMRALMQKMRNQVNREPVSQETQTITKNKTASAAQTQSVLTAETVGGSLNLYV